MATWKIYYGDGSTFSNKHGGPEQAPTTNVIAIAHYDEDGRRKVASSADYYWFDGIWHGGDSFGLWDYLSRGGWCTVKFGRLVSDKAWHEVMAVATSELPLSLG